jgi:hypothetical protein
MDGAGVVSADECAADAYAESPCGLEAFERAMPVALQVSWAMEFVGFSRSREF